MKIILILISLAFVSCSHTPTKNEEARLIQEVTEINSTLNDLTYAVHRPLYNIPEE